MTARGKTIWMLMLIIAFQMIYGLLTADTIFNETMGAAATTTEIPDYTGWYNYGSVNYTGTADARSTWNSAGDYPGASGAGNIYFVGGMDDYFQISGISTSGYRNIRLSLSLYKSNSNTTTGNAENGSNFNISYSVDNGISWRRLPITIPTGANTVETYYWRELSEYLPATDNLTLRFTNIGTTEPVHFRMDDVTLNGDKDSIFTETIGIGATNTEIGSFTGWTNSSPIAFSGNGFVRNDLPSTDKYTGATGGGNVLLDSGQFLQISGINTVGYSLPVLSVGVMKASAAENGSRLLMAYSTDGVNWSTPQPCNTTASGTNLWYRKHFSGIPVTANLYLKFSNTSTVGGSFRIDDIGLFSSLNAPTVGFPASSLISSTSATLSANIIRLGGANVTQRGFYYSTTNNFADGEGTILTEAVSMSQPGIYSLATGVLLPNTVYYYKAFATSSSGTNYSGQNTFTTLPASTTTTFTMDNTLPTGGTNFQTYAAAVTYLNANFAASSTGFTFLVKDGQEFADTGTSNYYITASGTATKQIIFRRDNSGSTRPKLSRTSTSNNVVVLSGADWVTFDGIDVKVAGNYGFYLVNNGTSTTNGSQYNTIKNCTVTGRGLNTGSSGIYHNYSATPTSEAGKHSYNVFQNVTVTAIKNGIILNGVATDIEISGCTITAIGSNLNCSGIKATNITNLKVYNNVISNLTTWSNYPIGINIASCSGNVNIHNNKISGLWGAYDVIETLVLASGIQVLPASAESDIRIYNNMI
ncbi:MAG: right-handed parallel beta-helix repeat-containing protein, partial [Candidatus Cloacimonetes bacterium]|nr:right-handed parallel beta-helix repeat-containing protein [Candidatus Cloacimonadota bacterium]